MNCGIANIPGCTERVSECDYAKRNDLKWKCINCDVVFVDSPGKYCDGCFARMESGEMEPIYYRCETCKTNPVDGEGQTCEECLNKIRKEYRQCDHCGREKEVSEFPDNRGGYSGWTAQYNICLECIERRTYTLNEVECPTCGVIVGEEQIDSNDRCDFCRQVKCVTCDELVDPPKRQCKTCKEIGEKGASMLNRSEYRGQTVVARGECILCGEEPVLLDEFYRCQVCLSKIKKKEQ